MDRQTIFVDFTATNDVRLIAPGIYFASSGSGYQQPAAVRNSSEAQLDLTTIVDDVLRAYGLVIERLKDR